MPPHAEPHPSSLDAEDVEREKAVVVVVAAEMATFLLAVNRIVRGVEIENQFLGRLRKRGDELIEQDTVRSDGDLAIARLSKRQRGGLDAASRFFSKAVCKARFSRSRSWSLRSS